MTGQFFFVGLVVVCGCYFVWRRKIDPLTVGFGSSVIYFAPAMLGRVGFAFGGEHGGTYEAAIEPMAYVVMVLVVLALLLAAMIADRTPSRAIWKPDALRLTPGALAGIGVVSACVSIYHVGAFYLCTDKALTMQHIGIFYYYAAYAIPTCIVAACAARQFWLAAAMTPLLLGDLFAGFRTETAITFLGLALLFGATSLVSTRKFIKYAVIVTVAGSGLFVVKAFTWQLKYQAGDACHQALLSTLKFDKDGHPINATPEELREFYRLPQSASVKAIALFKFAGSIDPYINAFTGSEPFVIQSTLNKVIASDFKTGKAYLVDQLLSGLPGGKSIFGIDVSDTPSFNQIAQNELFPDVPFGMANNPWAQAFASGGLGMVLLFATAYAAILLLLTYLFTRTDGVLKGVVSVLAAWIAFYFHRNDLQTEIGVIKHVVYIAAVGAATSVLLITGLPQPFRQRKPPIL